MVFSGHAIHRRFEQGISRNDVLAAIAQGETIAEHPDADPYPGQLLLGFMGSKPQRLVLASDENAGLGIIVTVQEPGLEYWGGDFRTRKR